MGILEKMAKTDRDRRKYLTKYHKDMYYSTKEQKQQMKDLKWGKSKLVV